MDTTQYTSSPSIEVRQIGTTTIVDFLGKVKKRNDAVTEFIVWIQEYLKDTEEAWHKPFVKVLMEIVKNIYDHGNGKATLTLINNELAVAFKFVDHNPALIIFDGLDDPKVWKKKTEHNFGHGLRMIQSIAKQFSMNLEIDDTKGGINYSGSYTKPIQ